MWLHPEFSQSEVEGMKKTLLQGMRRGKDDWLITKILAVDRLYADTNRRMQSMW